MYDITSILLQLNFLMGERYQKLVNADASNYRIFNESTQEKMIPIHIVLEVDINELDKKTMAEILKIEQMGRAVGMSVKYNGERKIIYTRGL